MLACKYCILFFFFKLLILHLDTDLRDHGGSGVLMYTIKCGFCVRSIMINHFNTNVSKLMFIQKVLNCSIKAT